MGWRRESNVEVGEALGSQLDFEALEVVVDVSDCSGLGDGDYAVESHRPCKGNLGRSGVMSLSYLLQDF